MKVTIPMTTAVLVYPKIANLGDMPRKKKKRLKKEFNRELSKQLENYIQKNENNENTQSHSNI